MMLFPNTGFSPNKWFTTDISLGNVQCNGEIPEQESENPGSIFQYFDLLCKLDDNIRKIKRKMKISPISSMRWMVKFFKMKLQDIY